LKFVLKNKCQCLRVSSALMKKLLDDDNFELLDIIFNSIKLFDNDFVTNILYFWRNGFTLSISELDKLIEDYTVSTEKSGQLLNEYYHSSYVFFINACIDGKFNLIK